METLLCKFDYNTIHEMVSWSHEQNKNRVDEGISKSWRGECKEKGALRRFFA